MQQSWKRNFSLIWLGQAVSQFSSSILQFAIVWYLSQTTGSPLVLSIAMLFGFLPQALLGPFIGVLIDRYNRKKIMIASDLFIAVVSLLLVLGSVLFPILPEGLIYFVLFLRSLGTAFHEPTLQAVTPLIVPSDQLTRCEGYTQSLLSVSQIFSPVLAAILFATWDLNWIVLLDVGGALFAVVVLLFAHIPALPTTQKPLEFQSVLEETKEGFHILSSNKGLFGLVLLTTLYSLAMMPISALFPIMSIDYFGGAPSDTWLFHFLEGLGGTASYAGFVEMVFAIGLLVGSVILGITGGTKDKMHSIYISFVIMMGSLFLAGSLQPSQFGIFVLSSFLMGLSGPPMWGTFVPLLQQGFPEESLGKVMSLSSSIRVLASPIGMIISGVFSERFGARRWFTVAGFMILLALVIALGNTSIRNCDSVYHRKEAEQT